MTQFRDSLEIPKAKEVVVIAHGPLTKQPETIAYRIVLCERDNGVFCVWNQCLPEGGKPYFAQGEYFHQNEFIKASKRFCDRLKTDICRHYDSLFRESEPCEQ